MSKPANKTLIGAFVVGGIALVVLAIAIFGSGKFLTERPKFVMYFEGSVAGLQQGAPVVFRGVRIGTVSEISFIFDPTQMTVRIPVVVELERERISSPRGMAKPKAGQYVQDLIDRGLRAKLGTQSMVTGQLMIELDFYPDTPAQLTALESEYPEIPTIPSTFERLSKTLETLPLDELVTRLTKAVTGIEEFVNSPAMQHSLSNLNASLGEMHALLAKVDDRVEPMATDVDKTLTEARTLLRSMDRNLTAVSDELRVTMRGAQTLMKNTNTQIVPISRSIQEMARAGTSAAQRGEGAFGGVEDLVSTDSAATYNLTSTLAELTAAASAIRMLAEYLQRHPEALLQGKQGQ